MKKWEGKKGPPFKLGMGPPEGLIRPCIHTYIHTFIHTYIQPAVVLHGILLYIDRTCDGWKNIPDGNAMLADSTCTWFVEPLFEILHATVNYILQHVGRIRVISRRPWTASTHRHRSTGAIANLSPIYDQLSHHIPGVQDGHIFHFRKPFIKRLKKGLQL